MVYQNRFVLFLDILGFKAILDQTIDKKGNDNTNVIRKTHNILSYLREAIGSKPNEQVPKTSRIVTQFSDLIVISFLEDDEKEHWNFFRDISFLLIFLMNQGVLSRGAITYGKIIHTDSVIFGPALVDAYLAESKVAIYPRVIIGKSVFKIFEKRYKKNLFISFNSILKEDFDDKIYFDYLLEVPWALSNIENILTYFRRVRRIIVEGLKSKNDNIKVKYEWLKSKFNECLLTFKSDSSPYTDYFWHSLKLKENIQGIKQIGG